ncbi:MAG: MerR family transcriptional regulator [Ruminococcus sp.]|nr:MerR family transcriptional regulator [Ruminococcus sp.]MDY2856372.1 MerR family transcriptional regulator [Oscillospiraceae bacterium]
MELISLKSVCELLKVSRRSIQCYEKAGLLMPTDKNKYGHLLYDESAFHRAKMIRFFKSLVLN